MLTRKVTGIGAGLGILLLILDGRTALEGARLGAELCLRTVIPSLFPFFVLSILFTGSILGTPVRILRLPGKLCGIPKGTEPLLLAGFLGGYPVGAQTISSAYHAGQLQKNDAHRMLAFCNNAGPSFLFGMTAPMFPDKGMVWTLWLIHMVSAVLTAVILPRNQTGNVRLQTAPPVTLSAAMTKALSVMASVCGWVILFRVIIQFLDRWILWILPDAAKVPIIGMLELSNGCCELLVIENTGLRFLVCAGMLAFGGLCVTMQTVSVTKGLKLRSYFFGKTLQTASSILLAYIFQLSFPARIGRIHCSEMALGIGGFLLFTAIFLQKKKNSSSIPAAFGV